MLIPVIRTFILSVRMFAARQKLSVDTSVDLALSLFRGCAAAKMINVQRLGVKNISILEYLLIERLAPENTVQDSLNMLISLRTCKEDMKDGLNKFQTYASNAGLCRERAVKEMIESLPDGFYRRINALEIEDFPTKMVDIVKRAVF